MSATASLTPLQFKAYKILKKAHKKLGLKKGEQLDPEQIDAYSTLSKEQKWVLTTAMSTLGPKESLKSQAFRQFIDFKKEPVEVANSMIKTLYDSYAREKGLPLIADFKDSSPGQLRSGIATFTNFYISSKSVKRIFKEATKTRQINWKDSSFHPSLESYSPAQEKILNDLYRIKPDYANSIKGVMDDALFSGLFSSKKDKQNIIVGKIAPFADKADKVFGLVSDIDDVYQRWQDNNYIGASASAIATILSYSPNPPAQLISHLFKITLWSSDQLVEAMADKPMMGVDKYKKIRIKPKFLVNLDEEELCTPSSIGASFGANATIFNTLAEGASLLTLPALDLKDQEVNTWYTANSYRNGIYPFNKGEVIEDSNSSKQSSDKQFSFNSDYRSQTDLKMTWTIGGSSSWSQSLKSCSGSNNCTFETGPFKRLNSDQLNEWRVGDSNVAQVPVQVVVESPGSYIYTNLNGQLQCAGNKEIFNASITYLLPDSNTDESTPSDPTNPKDETEPVVDPKPTELQETCSRSWYGSGINTWRDDCTLNDPTDGSSNFTLNGDLSVHKQRGTRVDTNQKIDWFILNNQKQSNNKWNLNLEISPGFSNYKVTMYVKRYGDNSGRSFVFYDEAFAASRQKCIDKIAEIRNEQPLNASDVINDELNYAHIGDLIINGISSSSAKPNIELSGSDTIEIALSAVVIGADPQQGDFGDWYCEDYDQRNNDHALNYSLEMTKIS